MGQTKKQIRIFQDESYKDLGILYGLFFEDINHAADGGLYGELVQNRSFEYCEVDRQEYHALTAWEKNGEIAWEVRTEIPLHRENPHYLHIEAAPGGAVYNRGYNTGIFLEQGKDYDFSLFAGNVENEDLTVHIRVETEAGQVCGAGLIMLKGREWKKYELRLTATETTTCGRLALVFEEGGVCDLDMVSLFPKDTFLGKKGGLRKDIAQALQEMHPKFLRFPGGCLVHDGSLNDHDRNSMYRWKRTIGRVEERPSWRNNWGYNQSLGLGYFEYFCFCEEIGAEPVPILPGGFNPHKGEGVALDELDAWVQDALDLIEFANGGTDTCWGKIREEMGHEGLFHLKYIGIGNEEIGDGFFERYPYFHRAIREKYPEIKIINTAGPFASGEGYEAGWNSANRYGSDLVDEHYYSSPEWFLANMHHYEDYDEKGPKVFLGEYASWGNTYYNALVEAAYMTHLERSKAVAMACYAPLLCNVDYVNWKPDMLWFDNHRILKTPNYYVQKLFMENQGTEAVRFETENLDEVIQMTEEKHITGDLTLCGNDVEGSIREIRMENCDTGEITELPEIRIEKDNRENLLGHMGSSHYKLSFRFKRTAGRKGLKISFGKKDDKNKLQWEFGGWDNWDCNLTSLYGGRGSTISHRIFHVGDEEYLLELEIEGRRIRTRINGELWNDVTDRLPELEELYVTAGVERCGENNASCGGEGNVPCSGESRTILKVVNLTGEEKPVRIVLEGGEKKRARVSCLKGYGLGDVNTFEEPEHIRPQEEWLPVEGNELVYSFAPHSVTVFSFLNVLSHGNHRG
ncbi:MAG: alpha-L-arabinofuranosidase [Butyrivibrio sp.]|nr:alpha-L-arabinofuranosidase [Acetatifactor muris]MCM1559964.1 alpha-L-arabinofuranosidase [Butyrivibrio sp.]